MITLTSLIHIDGGIAKSSRNGRPSAEAAAHNDNEAFQRRAFNGRREINHTINPFLFYSMVEVPLTLLPPPPPRPLLRPQPQPPRVNLQVGGWLTVIIDNQSSHYFCVNISWAVQVLLSCWLAGGSQSHLDGHFNHEMLVAGRGNTISSGRAFSLVSLSPLESNFQQQRVM